MILTRIQIENYKQYQGSHDIAVPNQATIGVIGENGAGKTTLFEAIEWCLYSPRAISPTSVRPRGYGGHTSVIVHLESSDGAGKFLVERVMKRAPTATIYRQHDSGDLEPVVQGTRQVSEYVATKLIGLSHTAFTATFFTRQKELHLFGDQTPGKRREEVGRLLGLETIRTAQKGIIADRSRATAEARALHGQYARESQGRDLPAEMAEAEAAITCITAQVAVTASSVQEAETQCATADSARTIAQQRRDEDAVLGQRIDRLGQERSDADRRASRAATELARLERRGAERGRLVPVAAEVEPLRQRVIAQERERERFERVAALERTVRDCAARQHVLIGGMHDIVRQVAVSSAYPDWVWTSDDDLEPVPGMRRLLGIVNVVDLPAAEHKERRTQEAFRAGEAYDQALATLERYRSAQAGLIEEERKRLEAGDPDQRITEIERERECLVRKRTTLQAHRTSLEDDRDKSRLILKNLDEQRFGDDCPTCGRSFSAGDAAIVIESMRQRTRELSTRIENLANDAGEVDRALTTLDVERTQLFAERGDLDDLRKRIQKSVSFLEAAQETVDAATAVREQAVSATGLTHPPTLEDVGAAEGVSRQLRLLVSTKSSLTTSLTAYVEEDRRASEAGRNRDAFGAVSFDPAAFQQLQHQLREADRAHSAIAQIDKDLARREDLIGEQSAATDRIAALDVEITSITGQRQALGVAPDELAIAEDRLHDARRAERVARDTYHRMVTSLREAEIHRDAIERERQRLARLATTADARQSDADHLDFMAKEFTEFERFAASRKRPILAEYTSHLVQGITDGKYDRVDFDQDFGIIVYDGDDAESSYAVDTFSGGERDAITLAARIALSQMIGRQAANPPGFLVLDEVFGSLDADRRAHLLDLLGSISSTYDELRQVFIISHVDDVRTSPVLDELWRIEATADGSSTITSLSPGAEIDAL